jgi:membrane protein
MQRSASHFISMLVKKVGQDDVSVLSASIAYYAFLSVFPLMLALIAIFGLILPSQSLQTQILNFFSQYFPGSGSLFQDNISDIIRYRGALGAVGILGLLWSSTGIFGVISLGVNRAWNIRHQRPIYIKKPREIAMVLGVGILFLLSLGISTLFSLLARGGLPITSAGLQIAAVFVAFCLSLSVFCLVYLYLPLTRVKLSDVWPGAILATLLFESGKYLFVLYLNYYNHYDRIYGSVASVIVMLLWTYFSGYVLLLGAEFSSNLRTFRKQRDSGNPPDSDTGK